MTEYVEKELLYKRLLEKSNDEKSCVYPCNLFIYALRDVFSELPTADVVEVVRCRDCKYCVDKNAGGMTMLYCILNSHYTLETNFCNYGERKEQ